MSKRKSSIEGQTERHCSASSCGLRGHHFDLGAEGDGVLGEHGAHRLEIDVGDVAAPAGIPIRHRAPVLLRHGQSLHCFPLALFPSLTCRLRRCYVWAMQKIDRQVAFTGTKDVAEPLRFDPARLEAYLAREAPGFAGPLKVQPVQGRAVEPDLSAGNAVAQIRAAAEAAGQAAAVGACGRPRIPRDPARCTRKRFPVAEPVLYCADESVTGTPFYVMGFVEGRVFWNPEMPGSNPRRARRDLRRDERDARAAALLRSGGPRACRTSAAARTTSRARSTAGRSSTAPRRPQQIDEMERLIEWLPAHIPPSGPVRLVHGDYRLDNMIFAAGSSRACWRCSTGSCRRSAIRSPTSPIT